MSTTHLLNNAQNAIKQCNLSEEERSELIKKAVSPLTEDELNHLVRETSIAAETAVVYYNKYKPKYETIKIKIGMIAVGINQFIITYRDKRHELKDMLKDMFTAMPNLDLSTPDLITKAISDEFFEETPPDVKETTLFKWTMAYFIKISNEVIAELPKQPNIQVVDIPEEADMNNNQTETTAAPTPEANTQTQEAPAQTAAPEATQPAAETVVEEAKEKEYVQWTREACADAHAEGVAKGEDAAKAAKRAALMGKLVGGFHENLDKAKEQDVKWETGVAGYEKRQESDKKDYVSKALHHTNPEPLLTKLDVHIVQPVVNKFLSWI